MGNQNKESTWEGASVQQVLPRDIGVVLDRAGVIHTVRYEDNGTLRVREQVPVIDEDNREICLSCPREDCPGQCDRLQSKRPAARRAGTRQEKNADAKQRVYVGKGMKGCLDAVNRKAGKPCSLPDNASVCVCREDAAPDVQKLTGENVEIIRVADAEECMRYLRNAYLDGFRDLTDAGIFNCILLLELALSKVEEEEERFTRLITEGADLAPEELTERLAEIHIEDTFHLSGMLDTLTVRARETAKNILSSLPTLSQPMQDNDREAGTCPVNRAYRELMEMIRRLSRLIIRRMETNLVDGLTLSGLAKTVTRTTGLPAEMRNRALRELENYRLCDVNRLAGLFCQMMDKDGAVMELYATSATDGGGEVSSARRFEDI